MLALLPAAVTLPAIATAGILAAALIALVAYEANRFAERRDEIRHGLKSAPAG